MEFIIFLGILGVIAILIGVWACHEYKKMQQEKS